MVRPAAALTVPSAVSLTIAGFPQATVIATLVAVVVSVSFPLYCYGAWTVIDAEDVTWGVLSRHFRYVSGGLLLTTVPLVTWMVPRLLDGFSGPVGVPAFFGLQAYAFLLFALTGIVWIVQAKWNHDAYARPDRTIDLDDLHENAGAWRARIRLGIAGYVLCWILAYVIGLGLLAIRYTVL